MTIMMAMSHLHCWLCLLGGTAYYAVCQSDADVPYECANNYVIYSVNEEDPDMEVEAEGMTRILLIKGKKNAYCIHLMAL